MEKMTLSLEELADAVEKGDDEKAKTLADSLIKKGESPVDIVTKGLAKAMQRLGEKYEKFEVFLTDLLIATEAFKEAMDLIKPHLKPEDVEPVGTVVIGTVEGDVHYLGKNLVATMLEAAGFKVVDLGEDVSAHKFASAVKMIGPDIVGMSSLLSTTAEYCKEVIKELENQGLRKDVKVMVGGVAVDDELSEIMGADGFAKDAFTAVEKAKNLLGGM